MTRQGERTPDQASPQSAGSPGCRCACFFDKTPEFVDLHLRWMHVPDEVAMDGGALLPGQIQPVKYGISCTVFDPADGPWAVALNEHGYCV